MASTLDIPPSGNIIIAPETPTSPTLTARRQILHAFDRFRSELDEYNDRRERLVKISRDVTIASKKVIFQLHRGLDAFSAVNPGGGVGVASASASGNTGGVGDGGEGMEVDEDGEKGKEKRGPVPDPGNNKAIKEGRKQLSHLRCTLMVKIAAELDGQDFWRYAPTISPGLQEYVEAVSFDYYLEHGTLITYQGIQATLSVPNDSSSNALPMFQLPISDYLLGVSDLTGELMRFAITAIGTRAASHQASDVCRFVRECHADFDRFALSVKGLGKKQQVTVESLKKIEAAIYGIVVRGSEYGDSRAIELVAQRYATGRGFSQDSDHGHGGGMDEDDW